MRPGIPNSVRRRLWVFKDPLPFAAAAAALLAFYLALRIPHWLKTLPPSSGWWYAVRHENYPPDLLLCSVLLAVLAAACLVSFAGRLVNRLRFGKAFADLYTPTEWQKHRIVERARANLCPACGYDVRQSSLVCPECGSPIRRRLDGTTPPPHPLPRPRRHPARGRQAS